MKKEKIILSLIAVFIGLLVAGAAFYFYESSKIIPQSSVRTISIVSSPTPKPSIFLSLASPKDEEVVSKKIITISGKTAPYSIISIITQNSQDIISPALNGDFSTTVTLGNGQSLIEITAISQNGESVKALRTVTFSTEEF